MRMLRVGLDAPGMCVTTGACEACSVRGCIVLSATIRILGLLTRASLTTVRRFVVGAHVQPVKSVSRLWRPLPSKL